MYGVDADIKRRSNGKERHLRRLAEVVHLLLDAGLILIVTAIELTQDDLEFVKTIINPDSIETIWIGEKVMTDIVYDLKISKTDDLEKAVETVKAMLQERGIILES